MGHGIETIRDYIDGLESGGTDWHKLTRNKFKILTRENMPEIIDSPLTLPGGVETPWRCLVSTDDGLPCGAPFDPETRKNFLPRAAWDKVAEGLAGVSYTVERCGMLWNRSFWFVSVSLKDMEAIAKEGERFFLNFSGALDGSQKPQGEVSHIRAVCWNTISASRASGKPVFGFKQTKNSEQKQAEVAAQVDAAVGVAAEFNRALRDMETKPADVAAARAAYAGAVVRAGGKLVSESVNDDGTPRASRASRALGIVDGMTLLFLRGDGNKGETRADILNGGTQWLTRGGDNDSRKNPWKAVASSEFGTAAQRKADLFGWLADEKEFKGLVKEGKEALKSAGALEFTAN